MGREERVFPEQLLYALAICWVFAQAVHVVTNHSRLVMVFKFVMNDFINYCLGFILFHHL